MRKIKMTKPNKEHNGIECRFAVHIPTPHDCKDDYHLVKEQIHNIDGTITPNIRIIKNFTRPFWVTKKGFRNHKSKKEWENEDHLIRYDVRQKDMRDAVAKALDRGWSDDYMRKLSDSPYLYGSDISTTACIKKAYKVKYPDLQSEYSVASFDIEFDVISGIQQIILITVASGNRTWTGLLDYFVSGVDDPITKLNATMIKYLGEYVTKRDLKYDFFIAKTEIELVQAAFAIAHAWRPDFLAIWNIDYDIPRIVEACERASVRPADIFSDPSIPKALRFFKYKQGKKQRVTSSGKATPISPAARWHIATCPSSFWIIDAMCTYKQIRTGGAEERLYSLDNILMVKLGIRKLKFEEANKYKGLEWHQFMQTNYKVEYAIYNNFDCISMLELDEKTKDLSLTLPMFSDTSDFSDFDSQPKRASDKLHWHCLEHGKVIGSTGPNMVQPEDSETLSLQGWIITLPAHLTVDNGLKCISEDPNLDTNIRLFVGDIDVTGAYPSGQVCFNISKETTRRELIRISGIDEYIFRMENINLLSGHVNAVEYCTNMFSFPKLLDLKELFLADQ